MQPRLDIQVLRGVAVLLVVFYHADLFPIPGGFLGVDIFFVISGFLITSTILRDFEQRRFSFGGFYSRRARRLLPAAFCTLLLTSALSAALLTPSEMSDFAAQLIGALTFSANLVLPFQTGYFDGEASGKPLLHMWSLSLEEQYYMALPAVLALCSLPAARKYFGPHLIPTILVGGVALSFAACLIVLERKVNWAFYLPFTRFWELLAGSVAGWAMLRWPLLNLPAAAKFCALALLIVLPFFPVDSVHPRLDAVIIVTATSLLMLGSEEWLPKLALVKGFAKVGDWSYSIYLVHWPLFAFAFNVFVGSVPSEVLAFLVVISIGLGFLQYRYVEDPFRRHGWGPAQRRVAMVAAGGVVVAAASLSIPTLGPASADAIDFDNLYRANAGLNANCDQRSNRFIELPECVFGEAPTVVVWGDSYAMHLVQGLVAEGSLSLVQITKSSCGPVLGTAFVGNKYTPQWAEQCVEFNDSAFEYIRLHPSLRYVVISSPFGQYFVEGDGIALYFDGMARGDHSGVAIDRFVSTVEKIKEAGLTPIVVAPPPGNGVDIGACVERMETHKLLAKKNCGFTRAEYLDERSAIVEGLKAVQARTNVEIFWPETVICPADECFPVIDKVLVYRDRGHLTEAGSRLIAQRTGLLYRLLE